ncbi:MAG TPA: ricin-type beta-trefoil lectin domain protein [Patescibacteria group bacterium]|nr:ricin-type beta-trefoil lectin domain protein [Patescibacteria group bacterium]
MSKALLHTDDDAIDATEAAKQVLTGTSSEGAPRKKKNKILVFLARNKRIASFVVGFAIVGGIVAIVATHAATNSGPITSAIGGKCLDVYSNGRANGTKVELWTCNGSAAQNWTLQPVPDNSGNVTVHVNNEDKCLDAANSQTTEKTFVQLWACNGSIAQVWKVDIKTHALVYVNGVNKCLDVQASGNFDGTQIWLWTCNGTNAQVWYPPQLSNGSINPTPTPPAPTPTPSITQSTQSAPSPSPTAPQSSISAERAQDTSAAAAAAANTKLVIVGSTLRKGANGARLKMNGVAVWGIQDKVTQGFGAEQYNNRQKIISTIKSWGANEVRFRLSSPEYYSQKYMTKARQLQEIKDWRDATKAAGMYFHISWWDSLEKGKAWASQYDDIFGMMTDVDKALGNDPMVIYEPFNEPNSVTEAQWITAFKATIRHFRVNLDYTGILLIDTNGWSHHYNDAGMTQLEKYDAGLAGMKGKDQLIFGKHDYANEGYAKPGSSFDSGHWARNTGTSAVWNFDKHMVWQTEFGNYNGSAGTVHYPWSAGAATWMAKKVNDGTLVGATAFLYGPWYDANALTTGNNTTPTQWGGYVKNNFLSAVK